MVSKEELEQKIEKEQQKLKKEQQKINKMKRQLAKKEKEETEAKKKLNDNNKILLGASVLSVLGRDYMPGDDQRLLEFLRQQESRGKFFSTAMNKGISSSPNDSETPRPF